jgi:hypothetical protein
MPMGGAACERKRGAVWLRALMLDGAMCGQCLRAM